MNRRTFIGSILAAGMAPAIVRAESLMRIAPGNRNFLLIGESPDLMQWTPHERVLIREMFYNGSLYRFSFNKILVSERVDRIPFVTVPTYPFDFPPSAD